MATDVGERVLFFFFLPKLELGFRDVYDFDGVISPGVAKEIKKGNKDFRFFRKEFFYILAMEFFDITRIESEIL